MAHSWQGDIYLYLYPLLRERSLLALPCEEYTPSTLDTYTFPNPLQHVNTVTMSELITTSSAYIINGDSPMTLVANTVAMTTLAVHTLQPLIFYRTLKCASTLSLSSQLKIAMFRD